MELIHPSQHFNVIEPSIITDALNFYKSQINYDTITMKKSYPGPFLDIFKPYIEKVLLKKIVFCSGNFYSHYTPYLPHTDYKKHLNNYINVVIPLEYKGQLPHLIIFDQIWRYDSVTWCMHYPVYKFDINTGVKGCPYEYPVENLTSDIDLNLHNDYLSQYPKHCLKGLTGTAFPYLPTSLIIFDNRFIHGTANWLGHKTGISLRYKTIE